jgi:hypothetical protein
MATSNREEARQRRAEARRSRRDDGETDTMDERAESQGDDSIETVKQAARVAAAAAALGAAVGAARALRGNGEDAAQDRGPDEPERDERRDAVSPDEPDAPEVETQPRSEAEADDAGEERDRAVDRPGASPDEARRVVEAAQEQLSVLLGSDADRVSGLEQTDGGWVVCLEVVELARIPESTDVMASYELTLDDDRKLVRYRRGRRYYRAQADADQGA